MGRMITLMKRLRTERDNVGSVARSLDRTGQMSKGMRGRRGSKKLGGLRKTGDRLESGLAHELSR